MADSGWRIRNTQSAIPACPADRQHPRSKIVIALAFLFFTQGLVFSEDNPLVDIQKVNPRIRLDIRYATTDNFMKEKLYPEARCLVRKEIAAKLSRIQDALERKGLGLKVFDAYRPLSVQKKLWARFPVEGYVANPAKGSNHNRGMAVDVTLVDEEGKELPMPSAYDEFSERSHRDYQGAPPAELENRETLEQEMEKEGFLGLSTEWWHFDDKDAKNYPALDLAFNTVAE